MFNYVISLYRCFTDISQFVLMVNHSLLPLKETFIVKSQFNSWNTSAESYNTEVQLQFILKVTELTKERICGFDTSNMMLACVDDISAC